MGRAHEVRAASMAKTAAAKSKLNNKWSKIIYMAAKAGVPDPDLNQPLKKEIEKAKKEQVTADVIKRAIEKAKGGSQENYSPIRYEAFGPNNSMFIIDCLTDNVNRTYTAVRTAVTRCGFKLGAPGSVAHMFTNTAIFSFTGLSDEETLEVLLMADCDVTDIELEDGITTVYASNTEYSKIRQALVEAMPDVEFLVDKTTLLPETYTQLTDEDDIRHFHRLMEQLDEVEDAQDVYHNVEGLSDVEEE